MAKKSREIAQLRSELALLRELFSQRELKELRQELAKMRMDFATLVSQSAFNGRDTGPLDARKDAGPIDARKDVNQIVKPRR